MKNFDKNLFKNIEPKTNWEIKSIEENTIQFDNNQETNLTNFMKLIFKNKISIINNKFNHNFVIGNDKNIYTINDYEKWNEQLNENESNIIEYANLKVGYVYQLEDLNSYFLYLGKKYYSSWKFNKDSNKIELTNIKNNHLGYKVYKHDNFDNSYYEKNCFNLKGKVVKEIKKYDGKLNMEILLNNIKYSRDYVYFENTKPEKELSIKLTKVSLEDLAEIEKKSEVGFINLFIESKGYLIKHRRSIYESALNEDEFHRQISKSNFNDVVFLESNNGDISLCKEKSKYYSYDTLLAKITTACSNDYFRIAPNNYYLITI